MKVLPPVANLNSHCKQLRYDTIYRGQTCFETARGRILHDRLRHYRRPRLYIWRRPCWFHGAHLPQALAAFVGAKDQAILAGPTSMRLQDGATLLMRAWPLPFAISTIWASQFYTTSHQFRLDACEIPWTRPVHIRVGAEFANKIRFDRWPKCKLGQSVAKYSWVLRYLCSTLPAQVPEQDFHFWTSSSKAPRQGAD